MIIFKTRKKLIDFVQFKKNLSFVPTMGSLHDGHVSLIRKAQKNYNKVIVSIFVNPQQFNSKKDFNSYPRNLKKDLNLLKRLKVNYVFLPDYKQIFSFTCLNKIFLDKFCKKLCGNFRPNHFKGVLNVVNRLIEIIKPKLIFLGEKDFQQLKLIQKHLYKRNIKTKVIPCKTIRNKDGLAISSRNVLLNNSNLKIAAKVIKFLKNKKRFLNNKNIPFYKKKFLSFGVRKIDYLKILNMNSLKYEKKVKANCKVFIAFYINNIRLIDNF